MVAIHETAYPQLKPSYSQEELLKLYTPNGQELYFARKHCRNTMAQIALLALLKTFQHLGYFLKWHQIPPEILNHIANGVGYLFAPQEFSKSFDESGSKYRYMELIRKYL